MRSDQSTVRRDAPITRAHALMPLWKLVMSYVSFGE
jgi:hypothetical protein